MRILLFIVLLSALLLPRIALSAGSDAADAMAEVMARMMEAMGLFDVDEGPKMPMQPYMLPGMGAFGYGQMPWMQMPGYEGFSDPIRAFGLQGLAEQVPGMQRWPWVGPYSDSLDGVWEGRDGGLLIVRSPRFRLQAAQGGHIEGRLERRGDQLVLFEPQTGSRRSYEMAMHKGRLVLRDDAGSTYLYRRLWLDEPKSGNR
jgi:hypothetical protein